MELDVWGSMSVDALIVMLGKVTWLMHACMKVTIGECYKVKLMIKNIHKKMCVTMKLNYVL